jgi:hypothetical protein
MSELALVGPPTTAWGNSVLDSGPGVMGRQEDIRTVWVYPPPIERDNPNDPNSFRFAGPSPVAGIEIRKTQIAP